MPKGKIVIWRLNIYLTFTYYINADPNPNSNHIIMWSIYETHVINLFIRSQYNYREIATMGHAHIPSLNA